MTDKRVSEQMPITQEHAAGAVAYFRKRRAACIAAYRNAELWTQRRDARAWALHYARILRNAGVKS